VPAIQLGFGASRKGGAIHVDVSASVVDADPRLAGRVCEEGAEAGADRFRKGYVSGDPVPEKCVVGSLAGPVVELGRKNHIARRILLLQTADSRNADDPTNVQRAKRIDISAMI